LRGYIINQKYKKSQHLFWISCEKIFSFCVCFAVFPQHFVVYKKSFKIERDFFTNKKNLYEKNAFYIYLNVEKKTFI